MRTTVDIDTPVLKELKRLTKSEGKPLGRLISELLAYALSTRARRETTPPAFRWISREMGARYSLEDREAILDAMDDPAPPEETPGR